MTERSHAHAHHSVLVVDDEPEVITTLSAVLGRDGLEVDTAANATEAFEKLGSRVPCMILADVMMPGIDGFAFCRQVKADPRTAHVPVALVTGRSAEADVESGIEAGAVEYIKKPFDRDEVRMRVRTHIRLHEAILEQQRLDSHLAVISAAAKDGIVMMNGRGTITHWNEAAEVLFGYSRSEAIGQILHTLVTPPRFRDAHNQAFPRFQTSGEGAAVGQTLELSALHKSGREFPIELSLSAARIDDEWCAVGIVRDITERKRMADDAREATEFLTAVLNAIPLPVFSKDTEGRFTGVNPAFEQFFGRSQASILGKTGFDLWPPDHAAVHRAKDLRLMQEQGISVYDAEVIDGQSASHHVEIHKATFTDGNDRVRGVIGAMRDLTERRRMETELGHARKLEAVGQLAAGIAHEINTPTQYVGDSVGFLQDAFGGLLAVNRHYHELLAAVRQAGGHDALVQSVTEAEAEADLDYLEAHVPDSLRRCLDGIARISTIVGAMKEFAHPDQREKTPADLNQAIQNTLVIANSEYKYVADVETDLGPLPPVLCHVGDLNQVFLNLIVNAAHAIADVVAGTGDRGRIRVTTRAEGEWVRIDVADSGGGIPEAIRHRVFEPFFTTKEVGKGSGQGLAIAHSVVVDKHRGALTFETAPGVGTTFTIRLPIDGAPITEGDR
jgi:two-component system, NtrC family, sensor kinase